MQIAVRPNAGYSGSGLPRADQVVVSRRPDGSTRIEVFSNKSRTFQGLGDRDIRELVRTDVMEMRSKHGGPFEIRSHAPTVSDQLGRTDVVPDSMTLHSRQLTLQQREVIQRSVPAGVKVEFHP